MGSLVLAEELVLIMGAIRVVAGGLGGLNQLLVRKLLAYSSISHLGWLRVIMCFSRFTGLYYYLFYLIVRGAIILSFLFREHYYINQYLERGAGFGSLTFIVLIGLFSLGGLPPFLGFFPK